MVNFRVFDHTENTLLPRKFLTITQAMNHRTDVHDMSEFNEEKKHNLKIQGFSDENFVREYKDKDLEEKVTGETLCACTAPIINPAVTKEDWCAACGDRILV